MDYQKNLNDAQDIMKKYRKIRWLSNFQAISTLWDPLEYVIVYFHDVPKDKNDGIIHFYDKFRKNISSTYIFCNFWLSYFMI